MSDDSIAEINFRANNVNSPNGRVYWPAQSLPVRVSFSDASDSACGAFVESDSELVFHHNWFPEEKVQSSTWRELKAVCLVLEALQVVCLTQGSSGIQTTRTLSLFFSTAAGNWICRH